jgi:hypothetical protein
MSEIQKYVIDDGKVYQRIQDDLFDGYAQVMPELPRIKPYLSYVGPKIGMSDWRSVVAFFKWAYEDSKSEVQVRLYFNKETGVWKPWAFPQKHGTGMTTTELPEKEGDERVKAGIAKGWIEGGTIHSHCSSSAFQSPTDKENESTKNGLHVTIGKVDTQIYDIHGRVSFKGTFYEVGWAQWFEMPEGLTGLPYSFRDDVMKYFLCLGIAEDQAFPQEWKDNVIKQTFSSPGRDTGAMRLPWGYYTDDERFSSTKREINIAGDDSFRRTKQEKKELRKDLKKVIELSEKIVDDDKPSQKIQAATKEVLRMLHNRATSTNELFMLSYQDPTWLDDRENGLLDAYEQILMGSGVLAADVEDWVRDLEIEDQWETIEKESAK